MKLGVFYHGLFIHGTPPQPLKGAFNIVWEQMFALESSGLLAACDKLLVGLNGPEKETVECAEMVIPKKAELVLHGPNSFSENLTLVKMEEFARDHQDWFLCYHHAKSCTHDQDSDYGKFATRWRRCMEKAVIWNWRTCVRDLESGAEAVGNHWLTGQGWDKSQHYFAGNCYWVKASFFAGIPSIFTRERIKMSGIASAESRYEAEVILGNHPRRPIVKDYSDHGLMACP
jgi:hypothetical protein